MIRIQIRGFSSSRCLLDTKVPRFLQTIKEASKPAQTKSRAITRPFGLDNEFKLNSGDNGSFFLRFSSKLFSSEDKESRQKQLDYDITHSPFYESKAFKNTDGKIFKPPPSYFKRDKAKYFPNFEANTLNGKHVELSKLLAGKVNILRVFSTLSGENCVNSYFEIDHLNYLNEGYEEFKKKYPCVQIVDLNMPEGMLKSFFVNLAKSNIKKKIQPERIGSYLIAPSNTFSSSIREALKCDNLCSGYIYLLDDKSRIRWATSGFATDQEFALMWKCVKGLQKELESLLS